MDAANEVNRAAVEEANDDLAWVRTQYGARSTLRSSFSCALFLKLLCLLPVALQLHISHLLMTHAWPATPIMKDALARRMRGQMRSSYWRSFCALLF